MTNPESGTTNTDAVPETYLGALGWYMKALCDDKTDVQATLVRLRAKGQIRSKDSIEQLIQAAFDPIKDAVDIRWLAEILAKDWVVQKSKGIAVRDWLPLLTPAVAVLLTFVIQHDQTRIQDAQHTTAAQVASIQQSQLLLQQSSVDLSDRQSRFDNANKVGEQADRILKLLSNSGQDSRQQRMLGISFAYALLCGQQQAQYQWLTGSLSIVAESDPDPYVQGLARTTLGNASSAPCKGFESQPAMAGSASPVTSAPPLSSSVAVAAAIAVKQLPFVLVIQVRDGDRSSLATADKVAAEFQDLIIPAGSDGQGIRANAFPPQRVKQPYLPDRTRTQLRYFLDGDKVGATAIAGYLREKFHVELDVVRMQNTNAKPRWLELWFSSSG